MLVTFVLEAILSDEMAFTGTWTVLTVNCCCRVQDKKNYKVCVETSSAVVERGVKEQHL